MNRHAVNINITRSTKDGTEALPLFGISYVHKPWLGRVRDILGEVGKSIRQRTILRCNVLILIPVCICTRTRNRNRKCLFLFNAISFTPIAQSSKRKSGMANISVPPSLVTRCVTMGEHRKDDICCSLVFCCFVSNRTAF